jgi:hypothetical protein
MVIIPMNLLEFEVSIVEGDLFFVKEINDYISDLIRSLSEYDDRRRINKDLPDNSYSMRFISHKLLILERLRSDLKEFRQKQNLLSENCERQSSIIELGNILINIFFLFFFFFFLFFFFFFFFFIKR